MIQALRVQIETKGSEECAGAAYLIQYERDQQLERSSCAPNAALDKRRIHVSSRGSRQSDRNPAFETINTATTRMATVTTAILLQIKALSPHHHPRTMEEDASITE